MNHLIKPFAWMLVLCVLLTGCGQSSTEVSSSVASEPTKTATLYTDRSVGNVVTPELLQEHEFSYSGTLTAEVLAQGLSELTGLDFFITATETVDGIVVDWVEDSTLIANLDDREQKEEFSFFEADSLRWFMLDSLWRTLTKNLDIENIYYSMNGGEDLLLEGLSLEDRFYTASPFMGSAYYRGHEGVRGEIDQDAALDLVFEALTLQQRQEDCPVVILTGEEVIDGETCWIFSAGSNSADGQKFTAMYHYAVSESGRVFHQDFATGFDWEPLEGGEESELSGMSEMTGEMSTLIIAFADAFFGGVQDPPAVHGVAEDSLLCTFIAANGEEIGVEFGRNPSIAPDQQMYLIDMQDDERQYYRVLFENDEIRLIRLDDVSGAPLTAAQYAAR